MPEDKRTGATRRELLQAGASALLVLPVVAACGSGGETSGGSTKPAPPAPPKPAPAPVAEPPAPPPPPAPPAAGGGDGKLVTDVAASASLVTALQYVNESSKPDQNCNNCQLYTAVGDGLGNCQLFTTGGMVKEGGWCASWAAKVS